MLQSPPIAPQQMKKSPITYPFRARTYGRESTPAPTAEETREKILPRTLPAPICEKVLSLNVFLLYIAFGDMGKSEGMTLYPTNGELTNYGFSPSLPPNNSYEVNLLLLDPAESLCYSTSVVALEGLIKCYLLFSLKESSSVSFTISLFDIFIKYNYNTIK